jgi:hypothetical protein
MHRFSPKKCKRGAVRLNTTIIGAKLKNTVAVAQNEVRSTATICARLRWEPVSVSKRYITGIQVAKLPRKRNGTATATLSDRRGCPDPSIAPYIARKTVLVSDSAHIFLDR